MGAINSNYGILEKTKREKYFILSDALNILDFLENEIATKQVKQVVFAIKTIYTIEMNLMYRRGEYGQLYDFIGGRMWSLGKQKKMIRSGQGRTTFDVNIKQAISNYYRIMRGEEKEEFLKIVKNILNISLQEDRQKEDLEDVIRVDSKEDALLCYTLLAFMCRFILKGSSIEQNLKGYPVIAGNSKVLSEARFLLDAICISCINVKIQYENACLEKYKNNEVKSTVFEMLEEFAQRIFYIPVNVDLIDSCYAKCVDNKNIRDKATEKDYYENFINTINEVLDSLNSYLGHKVRFRGIEDKEKTILIELYGVLCYSKEHEGEENKSKHLDKIDEELDKMLDEMGKGYVQETYLSKFNLGNIKYYSALKERLENFIGENGALLLDNSLREKINSLQDISNQKVLEYKIEGKELEITKKEKEELKKLISSLNETIEKYNKDVIEPRIKEQEED